MSLNCDHYQQDLCPGKKLQEYWFVYFFPDIDECFQAAIIALRICEDGTNTQCLNVEGSFDCTCVPGHHRVNGTCQRKIKFYLRLPLCSCKGIPYNYSSHHQSFAQTSHNIE